MPLISIHVTSKRSGLDALEKLTSERAHALSRAIVSRFPGSEVVTLRTCNRFEAYLSVPERDGERVRKWVDRSRFAPDQFILSDRATVSHLFSVAAGLDSELIGEDEVLGQVRSAYLKAKERGEARSELVYLFERAIFTGRRVRQETGLSSGMRSLSRLAIEEVRKVLPDLPSRDIGILGSGEMGEKILSRLVAERATRVTIASRMDARRRELAGKWGVPIVTPKELWARLSTLDVLFCASDPERPVRVLSRKTLRRNSPLVVVDLGMPRNIQVKRVGQWVRLIDLKELQRLSRQISKRKTSRVPAARAIVHEEAQRYVDHIHERDVAHFADQLLSRAFAIASDESLRAATHFNREGTHEKTLDNFGRAIVKRLLLPSLARLKSLPESERSDVMRSAAYLLGAESPPSPGGRPSDAVHPGRVTARPRGHGRARSAPAIASPGPEGEATSSPDSLLSGKRSLLSSSRVPAKA